MLFKVFSLLALVTVLSAEEEAPVCKKCQVIREYNAAHPENNYYWYDDYLKDHGQNKDLTSESDKPKFACGCGCGRERHVVMLACGCGGKKKRPTV